MKRIASLAILLAAMVSLFLAAPAAAKDKLFFISRGGDQVSWFDWATQKKGPPVKVPPYPTFVVQGQDPNTAFVVGAGKHKGNQPLGPGSVSIIETTAKKVIANVEVGWGMTDFYWSPDRSRLFILTGAVGLKPDAKAKTGLYIFNINSRQIEQVLPLNYNPTANVLSPDGKLLAVATAGLPSKDAAKAVPAALQVYDLEQGSLVSEAPLPVNPVDVAFSPDGGKIFVLTAGYPNKLVKDYPQVDPGAPVEASVNAWDVAGRAMIGAQKVGSDTKHMLVAANSAAAYLTATIEKKPAVVYVSPIDGVRNYTTEKPISKLIEDPQGRVLYLVGEKSVDVLDVKTWSKVNSMAHQEKLGMLTVGTIPDGRGFVFERDKRRVSFYDPASNQVTVVSVGKPANLLIKAAMDNKSSYLQKETVQIVGNKMYLLPNLATHVAVVDLTSLQMIKEIPITLPGLLGRAEYTFPESIDPNPLGNGLLASSTAVANQFSVVPVNTDTDEMEKGYKVERIVVKVSISFNDPKDVYDPVTGRKLGGWEPGKDTGNVRLLVYGPLLDEEHKMAFTQVSGTMYFIDLTTGKGGSASIGSGDWDPQVADKVEWAFKKKGWFNFGWQF